MVHRLRCSQATLSDHTATMGDRMHTPVLCAVTVSLTLAAQAARSASPPFSFTYGGVPADLSRWTCADPRGSARLLVASQPRPGKGTVKWFDATTGLQIAMEIQRFNNGAREWVLTFENRGTTNAPLIEDIQALDLTVPLTGNDCSLHYSLGDSNSADSFRPISAGISDGGGFRFAPNGGRSSDGVMPYFSIHHAGGGMAFAIGWSGQWAMSCHRERDRLRIRAGLELTRFVLHPGEKVRTPRILVADYRGSDPILGPQAIRRTLIEHHSPRRDGAIVHPPICGTVGEVDPDGTYEGPHIRVIKPLAANGIEVFWSDMDPQQWYPGGFPNGTGTWEVDRSKYPRGLKPIGDAAREAGLGYLLWFEPERVAAGTQIAREHPEWVSGGPNGGLFRLDIPEARQWLTDKIDAHISTAGLQWVRWDFNMPPLAHWRASDAPDRQGITEIRHIEGLYAMWDELARRHPGLLMDICASGGRRLDFEMLRRGLPLWHSDLQCEGAHPEADQLQNAGLYRWIPLHACGVFGLEPSYAFRSAATTGNVFALAAHAPENAEGVKRSVAVQRRMRPLTLGDFHPLTPHSADADRWFAYQFHRSYLDAGYIQAFRRAACANAQTTLTLRGLKPRARYSVTSADGAETRVLSGAELQALVVEAADKPGSALIFYERASH